MTSKEVMLYIIIYCILQELENKLKQPTAQTKLQNTKFQSSVSKLKKISFWQWPHLVTNILSDSHTLQEALCFT